jgi:hypothetical protein
MKLNDVMPEIERELISYEISTLKLIKYTNKGKNEIYIFTYQEAPNLMLEVARLREISFRQAGGGTGKHIDIDKYDLQSTPYKQLIVWNPSDKQIIGGYRFAYVPEVTHRCLFFSRLVLSEYYKFSDTFLTEFLPHAIELGRAFIQPRYQATRINRKSLFALDNLFDGLGALISIYPDARYFFGKVTVYKSFPVNAKQLLFEFLYKNFGMPGLVYPVNPVSFNFTPEKIYDDDKEIIEENYITMVKRLKEMGVPVPPMISAYLKLSPTMKVLGTIHDKDFGEVDETAILITISDIYEHKIERHRGMNESMRIIKSAS